MKNLRFALSLLSVTALGASLCVSAQSSGKQGVFSGSKDIGTTLKGAAVYDAASKTYRVTGGGADLWGETDDFRFAWVRLSGDAAVTADIRFPDGADMALAKALLMFRQTLDAGSPYADAAIHADGHITLQYRLTAGGKTDDIGSPQRNPKTLRIERKGNLFTVYASAEDGKMAPFASYTVPMTDPVYVGIGVCSHKVDGVATAAFSNLSIEPLKARTK